MQVVQGRSAHLTTEINHHVLPPVLWPFSHGSRLAEMTVIVGCWKLCDRKAQDAQRLADCSMKLVLGMR